MTFFDFISRHARAIAFTTLVLSAAGLALLFSLPVSLFPDINFPRIVILADNGEQPAERMIIEVTKPLEELARSIPGIKTVRSVTGRGSTEISLGLDWGTDIPHMLQLLQGRIGARRNELPPGASIRAEQMSVAVFPILGYSLTSDSLSQVELRDIAAYQIRPVILRVDGVARVEVTGGDTREFVVTVNPGRLAGYRLDIRQIDDAIRKSNLIEATGLVDNNYQLYLSLVSGLLTGTEDIGEVVITVRNGVPIRVRDVADVNAATAPNYIRTTAHGRPAVLINVIKQPTGSTVRIGQEVQRVVSSLSLPTHVHFENWYDQGDFINSSISSTRDAIVIGILLSMVVLIVFLRSWRITLVVLVVVPVTIALTILCLRAAGQSINIMTLGGIAAAVGLIIDDSIVVIERVFAQHARESPTAPTEPLSVRTAIAGSLNSLMPAIVSSTLSTIVINVPLLFLGGVTGAFFAPLALTMIFALGISFVMSIVVTPLLVSLLSRRFASAAGRAQARGRTDHGGLYERALGSLLRVRYLVIPLMVAIASAAYFIYLRVGSGFMPDMDEGTFVLDYISPPGTSLDETDRMLRQVEDILGTVPEVDSYSRRTGTQLGFFLTEPNTGDFLIKLKKQRSRPIDEVIAAVRAQVERTIPTLEIDFGQLMMDVIGDLTNSPKPIEIKLFGNDLTLLQSQAKEVAGLIENVTGVVDVRNGIVISGPSLIVHVDPTKAAVAGLTADDVQGQLAAIMQGQAESNVKHGEKIIAIRVRYPEEYRRNVDLLGSNLLTTPAGTMVPLRSLATIEKTPGQAEIARDGLRPVVAVTARIENRDLGHTISDIKRTLATSMRLPMGVRVEYGGIYQTQQESFRGLLFVAVAAAALVFLVLLVLFEEFAAPIAILSVSMLSLIGVVFALWITGITFNVSSFVGLIMIIGIVAENAVFVLYEAKRGRAPGQNLNALLVVACQRRARPIIMTALAAILALLPLALGLGAGAQMQQPLAVAVIGGFCVSALLLFFVLPFLYRVLKGGRG
ncbi:MAG: efflux RND transporter permease subunit [candidate division Zixibacteria bacterium]|nr:efflux RND transporter permease subunit [candidate division Zixibacteria bacterium]